MKDKLKPCPFCGGEAELRVGRSRMTGRRVYTILCTNVECPILDLKTKMSFDKKQVIEEWNRRIENEYKPKV